MGDFFVTVTRTLLKHEEDVRSVRKDILILATAFAAYVFVSEKRRKIYKEKINDLSEKVKRIDDVKGV